MLSILGQGAANGKVIGGLQCIVFIDELFLENET